MALWTREAGVGPAEAERRLPELLLIATDRDGRLAAVSTAYLQWRKQLRAELWHFRVYVAEAHRQSGLAIAVAVKARDHLVHRYVSGEDRRGIGVAFIVQSEILKRLHQARWPHTGFLFIGETVGGYHLRVHYFPRVPAPEPDQITP